ncbi:CHAT domain-containing protein [Klenkia soli]|uniref:CHAT domain-containing protein n=1 Tax=Klenkia soli TaxID=1052260 RepID=A0A1H0CSP9_9ACTN|nr:CHAT domain-containing protein [Klenkia soli]SDN60942.1 CHAT domain-containing protein [Klenkia soli]
MTAGPATAAQLYDRAVGHTNAGRLAAARRTLRQAARRGPGPDLAARIDGTLAYLEAETGDPAAALARIRAAVRRPGVGERTRAVLVGQAGLVAMRRGDTEDALRDLGRAVRQLRGEPALLGQVALNRGNVHLQRGDLTRAGHDFAVARDAFRACGAALDEAKAQHNLGYTDLLAGDLVPAITRMDAAREVLSGASPLHAATCDTDRAAALLAAGMPAEAEPLLVQAAAAYGRARVRQPQAEAELLLARTLLHHDPARAGQVARRAARRFRTRGADRWARQADGVALSAAAAHRPTPGLGDRLDRAAREPGTGADRTRLRMDAAAVRIAVGDHAGASAVLRRGVPPSAPIPLRLLARTVRADLAAARGRPDEVLRTAAAGLDELTAAQARVGSLDLQSSLLLHARPLLDRGLRAALAGGRPDVLLAWTERARDVVTRVPALGPPSDPVVAEQLAEVRRLRVFGAGPVDAQRERALLESLRGRLWHEPGRGLVRPPVDLAAVHAAAADRGVVVVAWCWTPEEVAAVVVGAGDPGRVVPLGPAAVVSALLGGLGPDLEVAAGAPPGALGRAVTAGLRERLAALADRLVAPLDLPAGAPAVLSVPAVFRAVPWGMLPGLVGRACTVPTSLAAWVRAGPWPGRPTAAAFAAGPGVPRAVAEVEQAAAAWSGATVRVGAAASVGQVAADAATTDVLHVSAHGTHHAEHPLFSRLELADGPWFGHDAQRLARVPQLVVLSACEGGRTAVRWGEETAGLSRAWLHAGAHCVIASAASLRDDVAWAVLPEVHRRLAAGDPPATALAAATGDRPTTLVCAGVG